MSKRKLNIPVITRANSEEFATEGLRRVWYPLDIRQVGSDRF
jgi:hypothetical protein